MAVSCKYLPVAMLLAFTPLAFTQDLDDCPIATTPYSAETVVLDLMIDPRTRAVVERHVPSVARSSGGANGEKLPGILGVITLDRLQKFTGGPPLDMAAIDRELSAIPVTPEISLLRCARYDYEPPALPDVIARPAILVFDKSNGFKDEASVNAAATALRAMAEARGWTLVPTSNGAVFNQRDLARFDAVVWNNVSGDALSFSQRKALQSWIEQGGGFAAMHGSGGDHSYLWDWYADTLIGARFIGHPPQFQSARVDVADKDTFVTAGSPPGWTMTEEWYSFKASPRASGAHVLLSLDESTYQPPQELKMGADHPLAWTRCVADGRSFYTAIGHRPENYSEPNSARIQAQGIAWAMGLGDTVCSDGREVPRSAQLRNPQVEPAARHP